MCNMTMPNTPKVCPTCGKCPTCGSVKAPKVNPFPSSPLRWQTSNPVSPNQCGQSAKYVSNKA